MSPNKCFPNENVLGRIMNTMGKSICSMLHLRSHQCQTYRHHRCWCQSRWRFGSVCHFDIHQYQRNCTYKFSNPMAGVRKGTNRHENWVVRLTIIPSNTRSDRGYSRSQVSGKKSKDSLHLRTRRWVRETFFQLWTNRTNEWAEYSLAVTILSVHYLCLMPLCLDQGFKCQYTVAIETCIDRYGLGWCFVRWCCSNHIRTNEAKRWLRGSTITKIWDKQS